MGNRNETNLHRKYVPLYNKLLTDIRHIKYSIFPEMDESRVARTPIAKLKEVMEKESQAPVMDESLQVIVRDLISQRFQSNLLKYKMLQQQEILRSMASGGITPEEAILILLAQASGEELEEKVLSKGKVSPQSMDDLYRFYTRIGDNIERLSQRKVIGLGSEEKPGDSPFFKE